MSQRPVATDILVVGAGIAGLMAAHALRQQGRQILVVDEGRRVGGRLATRSIGPGRADHGAQFFTVRSAKFQSWVKQWVAEGLVYRWSTGWSDGSLAPVTLNGHPRYAVYGGMNSLASHLARELDTQVNVRLTSVKLTPHGWESQAEQGQVYTSQALVLTPPMPQTLALLDAGPTPLTPADRYALEQIDFAPCLVGLFWLDGSVHLPEPGAIQHPYAPISWIADNQRKGISPEATVVTVHAGSVYSYQMWNAPEAEVVAALQTGLQPYLALETSIIEAQLKHWRYALPTSLHPEPYLLAANLPPLVFAGDAFGGSRVEGAALSGLAAAEALAGIL
ncbi:MAG: FAD-dependent oxidoreductase [Chloroflexota bacterium]